MKRSLFNGVVVSYKDPSGTWRSVGPPGANTDSQHKDLAVPHPALTAHGVKRWGWIDIPSPATRAGAVAVGSAWLAEQRARTAE